MKASCAAGFPAQHDTFVLKELKTNVKKGDHGLPHDVVEYPNSPRDLPFFESAYEDEEKLLGTTVSLSKTNREAKAHRRLQQGEDGAANMGMQSGQLTTQQMMMLSVMMKGNKPDSPGVDLEMLQPKKKAQKFLPPAATGDDVAAPCAANAGASGSQGNLLAITDASTVKPPTEKASRAEEKEPKQWKGPPKTPERKSLLIAPKDDGDDSDGNDLGPAQVEKMLKKKPASKTASTSKNTQSKTVLKKPAAKTAASKSKPSVVKRMAGGWTMELCRPRLNVMLEASHIVCL